MNTSGRTAPLVGGTLLKDEPPEVRNGFIRKVYGILSAQLLLTAVVATPFVTNEAVKNWVHTNGAPVLIAMTVLNIALLFGMACCCEQSMRTFPTNYFLLFAFTASEGFLVGAICSTYTGASVLLAVFATGLLVGGLTLFAMTTKSDFTGMGVYLFAAALVLMIFGIFAMFFPFMKTVYCCAGILVFSFYLIYDTQMVMGKGELRLGVDDYVRGALELYLDIIQLFLYIMETFGTRD